MRNRQYVWEPGGGLFVVEEGNARRQLSAAEPAFETAIAHMLADAEAPRLSKPRPPRLLAALTSALAGELPADGFELRQADLLRWVDGPGLDVILEACLSGARGPNGARSAGRRGR